MKNNKQKVKKRMINYRAYQEFSIQFLSTLQELTKENERKTNKQTLKKRITEYAILKSKSQVVCFTELFDSVYEGLRYSKKNERKRK